MVQLLGARRGREAQLMGKMVVVRSAVRVLNKLKILVERDTNKISVFSVLLSFLSYQVC